MKGSIMTKVILKTKIVKIEEKFENFNWHKDAEGRTANSSRSLGWFIQFEGSAESIKLFDEKPEWNVGDAVRISFEREGER